MDEHLAFRLGTGPQQLGFLQAVQADADANTAAIAALANDTYSKVETDQEIDDHIQALIGDAGTALDTLGELADAINDDSSFATTIVNLIGAEESARISADTTLTSDLAAETAARSTADQTLTTDLAAETSARVAGDNTLTNSVNTLTSAIAAEETARIAADALKASQADLASLTTTVSGNTAAIATNASAIGTLATQATISALTTTVNGNTSDIAANSNAISSETAARTAADTTLTNNLAAEETARIAADNTLTTSVSTLTSDLTAETTARTAADTTLTNSLATEETARIAADNTLTADLAAEVTARTAADTTLTNSLATEETARIAGDNTLTASVNTLTSNLSNKADKSGTSPLSITVGSSQIPLDIQNTSNNWSQKITSNAYGMQLSTNSNSSAASLIKCIHNGHSTNCFEVSGDGVTDVASLQIGGTALKHSHLSDSGDYSTTAQMNTALAAKAGLTGNSYTGQQHITTSGTLFGDAPLQVTNNTTSGMQLICNGNNGRVEVANGNILRCNQHFTVLGNGSLTLTSADINLNASGNVQVAGSTLASSHLADASNLVVKDTANVLEKQLTLEKSLKFQEDSTYGSNAVRIKAENITSDYQLLLPPTLPADTSAKYLTSTTTGQLSWEAASGGGGGGSSSTLALIEQQDWDSHIDINSRPYPTLPLSAANSGRPLMFLCWRPTSSWADTQVQQGNQHVRLPQYGTVAVGTSNPMVNCSSSRNIQVYTYARGEDGSTSTNQQIFLEQMNTLLSSGNKIYGAVGGSSDKLFRLTLLNRSNNMETWLLHRNN